MTKLYRQKLRKDSWGNFTVLRHNAFDGMLVTSKNSGTHWLKYMLALALAETYEIDPPEYFSEDAVRPYISWTKDQVVHDALPRLAFSHTIPHRLVDWGWARQLAGLPPYVLLVRHPMQILASHYAKWAWDIQVDWLTYLKGEASGKRYRCDLFWLARFWHRWGVWLEKDPARIYRVHYEDLQKNPEEILTHISNHWGIGLSPASIRNAVHSASKAQMAKKIDPKAEPNVLQNRREKLSDLFKGEAYEIYAEHIAARFPRSLGYDLLTLPE